MSSMRVEISWIPLSVAAALAAGCFSGSDGDVAADTETSSGTAAEGGPGDDGGPAGDGGPGGDGADDSGDSTMGADDGGDPCAPGDGACGPGCSPSVDTDCACPELAERVTITAIDIDAAPVASPHDDTLGGWWTMGDIPPVVTALEPDDELRVAWQDGGGMVHVTPLDALGQRKGDDLAISAAWLRGLAAHDDGAALLLARGEGGGCISMDLVRLDDAGGEVFATTLTDADDCHSSTHMGRLVWDGAEYGAYFGIHGTAGFSEGHEGDKIKMVDGGGQILDGGWEWGCSHSMDMQLASVGGAWVPLCISDCYPGQGIYVGNAQEIAVETGDCAGQTNARFGGMAALGDALWVAYGSVEGRPAYDVALAGFTADGQVTSPKAWLTETPGDEANVKLARYGGDSLLASWSSGGMHVLQRLDAEGAPQGDPVPVGIDVGPLDDLQTTSTGDVVWAYADAAGGLSLGRVAYCE